MRSHGTSSVIVNLHVCICKNKICIWSDPGENLPICKYTPVCICVRMHHLLTPSKICTPEYIYTCVFLAHANWTLVKLGFTVVYPVFLCLNQNIHCGYSLEPLRRCGSNVYPQSIFRAKIREISNKILLKVFIFTTSENSICTLHGLVFVMTYRISTNVNGDFAICQSLN